jgi:precorrin-8X/cobalt-precorrin-8 methylmutase
MNSVALFFILAVVLLVIGVPVGFVNVVESKQQIMDAGAPYIVARGRKGGSNVAAAICNAMLYQIAR